MVGGKVDGRVWDSRVCLQSESTVCRVKLHQADTGVWFEGVQGGCKGAHRHAAPALLAGQVQYVNGHKG